MTITTPPTSDLVVIANRLPFKRVEEGDVTTWIISPGGLVAALKPAMERSDNMTWVGWAGDVTDEPAPPFSIEDLRLAPVSLSAEDIRLHYAGMSNGSLWPLYHDKIAPPEFHRSWFDGYRRVNQKFADVAAANAPQGAQVWIHDYQLHMVPSILRKLRPDLKIGFFLHIPFPPGELFNQMPWRSEIIEGTLGADLIGFQTQGGADNFARVAVQRGLAERQRRAVLAVDGRQVHIRTFPVGIDFKSYNADARRHEITDAARDVRAGLGQPHIVLLGIDRLDYTKGIEVRLRALNELLADGQLHPSRVVMVQVAEPSRDDVDAYQSVKATVEQLVGQINGDFGRVGFPVVHFIRQAQVYMRLLALYRAADVMLVTPFRDGMNLVAKEYVATRYNDSGVLVLSEFAGAAHHLKSAVQVNPYDIVGVKKAIMDAINLSPRDRRRRMRALRKTVQRNDANHWADSFLTALDNVNNANTNGITVTSTAQSETEADTKTAAVANETDQAD